MLKIDSYCSHPARLFPHDRGFFAPYHRFVTSLIKHNVILLSFSVCKPAGSEFMFRYHQRIIPLPAMGFFQRRPRPYHTEVSVRLLGFCISHIETVIPVYPVPHSFKSLYLAYIIYIHGAGSVLQLFFYLRNFKFVYLFHRG